VTVTVIPPNTLPDVGIKSDTDIEGINENGRLSSPQTPSRHTRSVTSPIGCAFVKHTTAEALTNRASTNWSPKAHWIIPFSGNMEPTTITRVPPAFDPCNGIAFESTSLGMTSITKLVLKKSIPLLVMYNSLLPGFMFPGSKQSIADDERHRAGINGPFSPSRQASDAELEKPEPTTSKSAVDCCATNVGDTRMAEIGRLYSKYMGCAELQRLPFSSWTLKGTFPGAVPAGLLQRPVDAPITCKGDRMLPPKTQYNDWIPREGKGMEKLTLTVVPPDSGPSEGVINSGEGTRSKRNGLGDRRFLPVPSVT